MYEMFHLINIDFFQLKFSHTTMNRKELEDRTKRFHINVLKLCSFLPRNVAGFETGKQLVRWQVLWEQIIERRAEQNQLQTLFTKLK